MATKKKKKDEPKIWNGGGGPHDSEWNKLTYCCGYQRKLFAPLDVFVHVRLSCIYIEVAAEYIGWAIDE